MRLSGWVTVVFHPALYFSVNVHLTTPTSSVCLTVAGIRGPYITRCRGRADDFDALTPGIPDQSAFFDDHAFRDGLYAV